MLKGLKHFYFLIIPSREKGGVQEDQVFSTYLRRWVLEEGQVQPLNHRDGNSVGEDHDVGYLLGNNVFHHLSEGLPRQKLLKMDLIYYLLVSKEVQVLHVKIKMQNQLYINIHLISEQSTVTRFLPVNPINYRTKCQF